MLDFLTHLFDASDFPPRWQCGSWTEAHGWLHILSDLGVWSAYFAIPCILVFFVLRRRDVPFRSIFWLFGAFILACGTTHLMEAIIFWHPLYRLAGVIKLLTAIVSWGTVVALVPIIPKALAMRSPEELEKEITARKQAEDALHRSNAELEIRVQERTAELARANATLRQSEERFHLAQQVARFDTFDWNIVENKNHWSPELLALYAIRPDEFEGTYEAWVRRLHPDDAGSAEEEIRQSLVSGRYDKDFRVIWPDGSVHWLHARAKVLYDEAGRPTRMVGINVDITERKRSEQEITRLNQELQSRADELQTILNILPIGVAIAHDPQCHRITHNPYMSELLNVPAWENASLTAPEDERPTNFTNYRDGTQVPASELPMQVACTGVEVRDVELDLVCRGRDLRKMLYHARPLFDGQGRVRGSVGVCLDITARKQVEEALRQSEQRFARFMQHLPGLAWIKDLQGRYVFANEAAVRVFRKPQVELCGRTDDELFPPEAAAQFKENDRRALESGSGVSLIESLEHDDGVLHSSLVNKFPIGGSDGEAVLIGGIAIDITDRLRAEKSLKEADRRKDEFLATLAHELRNPLAPIRNSLELMKRANGNSTLIEQARTLMERQVGQMVRLIDDLLDISRISNGKLQLRRERVQLEVVVQSAVEVSHPLIEAQSHELTVTVPQETIYLDADQTRLSQIISNLLNNAAKYTEKGGHIWLTAEQQGGEAVVSVRDTGIGIAAEYLAHIFEMFSQVAPALERSQAGLGVGLALVRGLVELHGGTIEGRSGGLGMGSEFIVRLPVAKGLVRTRQQPVENGVKSRSGPTYRILVVDDNRDAADSLAMVLRLMGHEIQTAHDGVEAVQAAATFRPDVLLLDIGMPKMNGYEAAQHIREQPWGKRIILVALTGWGQDEDKRRATEAGFHYHLTKPVEPAALEQLLEGLMQPRN